MDEIYDKSIWPCHCPELFWALNDPISEIAKLEMYDEDVAVYKIDINDLPDGKNLWRFNALRNIEINDDSWPRDIYNKIQFATLCLGEKPLQTVKNDREPMVFDMFSTKILPLFVLDHELTVRIHFRPSLDDKELYRIPRSTISADGLLVRINNKKKAFFISASKESTFTWDGENSRVVSCYTECEREEKTQSENESSENITNDRSTYEDLWNLTKLKQEQESSSDESDQFSGQRAPKR